MKAQNCLLFFTFFSQALYFSYGFGAFVSPLIAEPFLSGTPHPDIGLPAARRGNPLPYGGMGHRGHHHLSHRPTNHMRDSFYTGPEQYKSEVQIAYWIIALAHVSFRNSSNYFLNAKMHYERRGALGKCGIFANQPWLHTELCGNLCNKKSP